MISLSEFLLQGPIGTLVGTTAIATKHEDVAFVEDLGFGTCCVLVSPSIRCRASDGPRSAPNLAEGFWIQHHYLTSFFGDPCEPVGCFKESVPMRVGTRHASAQLTTLPAFSSTDRTGKCYCLLRGQVFGFHSWHDEASQSGKLVNCEQISGSNLSSWRRVRSLRMSGSSSRSDGECQHDRNRFISQ